MKIANCYILLMLVVLLSCQKTSVYFKDNSLSEDPNITFWDNYSVSLSTYKLDTFATSNDSVWVLGSHADPEFGRITATSFAEISYPESHPFDDSNIIFDSAVVMLVPNGNYYGDTTAPYRLNVYTLAENLGTDIASAKTYYNINSTPHNSTVIGSLSAQVTPLKKDTVFIRLAGSFATDLYNQMKNSSSVIKDQAVFRSYLKGICIEPDSLNNKAIYQFSTTGSAGIIRMYYTVKGLYNENKYYDLTYIPSKQYNQISFNYNGSTYSPFSPRKSQLIESSGLNNKALLNNYIPSLVKIGFPDILNVMETYPFVKIMKAELEIRVNQALNSYPYFYPQHMLLYISNQNNELSSYIVSSVTGEPQTGDLVSDPLVENGTRYTYDITSYINTLITEGRFSTKSLFLSPYTGTYNSETSRLVLNAQSADPDIRLKLYVLGL